MSITSPAERLESYRWRNKMQVTELADKLKISVGHMSRVLRGETAPGPLLAERIKKLTGIRFPPIARGRRVPLDDRLEAGSG